MGTNYAYFNDGTQVEQQSQSTGTIQIVVQPTSIAQQTTIQSKKNFKCSCKPKYVIGNKGAFIGMLILYIGTLLCIMGLVFLYNNINVANNNITFLKNNLAWCTVINGTSIHIPDKVNSNYFLSELFVDAKPANNNASSILVDILSHQPLSNTLISDINGQCYISSFNPPAITLNLPTPQSADRFEVVMLYFLIVTQSGFGIFLMIISIRKRDYRDDS
jgi:hypothetical protein